MNMGAGTCFSKEMVRLWDGIPWLYSLQNKWFGNDTCRWLIYSKFCAPWMPWILTDIHLNARSVIIINFFHRYDKRGDVLLRRLSHRMKYFSKLLNPIPRGNLWNNATWRPQGKRIQVAPSTGKIVAAVLRAKKDVTIFACLGKKQ